MYEDEFEPSAPVLYFEGGDTAPAVPGGRTAPYVPPLVRKQDVSAQGGKEPADEIRGPQGSVQTTQAAGEQGPGLGTVALVVFGLWLVFGKGK